MKRNILFIIISLATLALQAQELTLDICRKMALENNETIKKATIEVQQANIDKNLRFLRQL